MLLELNISDFAIIERLNLRLGAGFNVLTGETGAGKSIIIDALGTLRGERIDASFVRAGCDRARVEGVFSISDYPWLAPILDEYGLWDGEEDQIILTREINRESGRSIGRLNGRAISNAVLREVGGRLVDIHGQHEGLALFNTRTHGEMLDRYGGLVALREQVAERVGDLRRIRDELSDLQRAAASRAERIEELRFLLDDVAEAKLRVGEEDELLRERGLVQNGARINELATSAYMQLYGGDQDSRRGPRPVIELLGTISSALDELARLDPSSERLSEQARDLLFNAEDLVAGLRDYRAALDTDPGRLDTIEDRLTLIRDMQRKYRGTIEQIVERASAAEGEIERLTHSEEHLAELEQQEQRLLREVGALAGDLSRRRQVVGAELAHAIVGAMQDLAMPYVRFDVQFTHEEDPRGVPAAVDGEKGPSRLLAFDKTGVDRVEFMLSPNPGEPLKPLARIASGGESARLLLALKSILSAVDDVPTLIFDEVDAGVGGRVGHVVGEKLWSISKRHQVVCITHQPQVASFADAHFAISKLFSSERTRTNVQRLGIEQRVDEIAAMLDGTPVGEHSRRSAQEMLERAQGYKEKHGAALRDSVIA
jgi:DNA repair protein RecN (Recombination protein N)